MYWLWKYIEALIYSPLEPDFQFDLKVQWKSLKQILCYGWYDAQERGKHPDSFQ